MKEVKLTGAQFKTLLGLGRVKVLEGSVVGKNGIDDDFSFSRKGAIRPPVGLIEDKDEVIINDILICTDVETETDDGDEIYLSYGIADVKAMTKIL